ncbi:hypothetical protein [Thermosulfuriphilus sp.]
MQILSFDLLSPDLLRTQTPRRLLVQVGETLLATVIGRDDEGLLVSVKGKLLRAQVENEEFPPGSRLRLEVLEAGSPVKLKLLERLPPEGKSDVLFQALKAFKEALAGGAKAIEGFQPATVSLREFFSFSGHPQPLKLLLSQALAEAPEAFPALLRAVLKEIKKEIKDPALSKASSLRSASRTASLDPKGALPAQLNQKVEDLSEPKGQGQPKGSLAPEVLKGDKSVSSFLPADKGQRSLKAPQPKEGLFLKESTPPPTRSLQEIGPPALEWTSRALISRQQPGSTPSRGDSLSPGGSLFQKGPPLKSLEQGETPQVQERGPFSTKPKGKEPPLPENGLKSDPRPSFSKDLSSKASALRGEPVGFREGLWETVSSLAQLRDLLSAALGFSPIFIPFWFKEGGQGYLAAFSEKKGQRPIRHILFNLSLSALGELGIEVRLEAEEILDLEVRVSHSAVEAVVRPALPELLERLELLGYRICKVRVMVAAPDPLLARLGQEPQRLLSLFA